MLKFALLGITQGLTEFFPISSSAHLVILQKILGLSGQEVEISVILHLGTCLALIIFFFKDILKLLYNIKLLLLIAIVTVITGIIGLAGKDFFEGFFSSTFAVATALVVTGVILILTNKFTDGARDSLTIQDAVILGSVQGIAIIPGISRSGITISALLFRLVEPQTCFRFSFLASIPAVLGAAFLEAKDIGSILQADCKGIILGFVLSLLSGLFSLWILKLVIRKARLHYFGYYCIIVAIITLLFIK